MDDLISRAAAIEALSTPCDKRYRHGVWEMCLDNIETAIRNIPAVDAAPMVRCRDCKWGSVTTDEDCENIVVYCNNPDCPAWKADMAVKPDWYCAYGERRDEE